MGRAAAVVAWIWALLAELHAGLSPDRGPSTIGIAGRLHQHTLVPPGVAPPSHDPPTLAVPRGYVGNASFVVEASLVDTATATVNRRAAALRAATQDFKSPLDGHQVAEHFRRYSWRWGRLARAPATSTDGAEAVRRGERLASSLDFIHSVLLSYDGFITSWQDLGLDLLNLDGGPRAFLGCISPSFAGLGTLALATLDPAIGRQRRSLRVQLTLHRKQTEEVLASWHALQCGDREPSRFHTLEMLREFS